MHGTMQHHAMPTVADQGLEAFTLFPKLPTEIQLKIWKLAMPGPRLIKIGHRPQFATRPSGSVDMFYQKSQKIPTPLLHTCRETRAMVLKTIKPRFRLSSRHPIYFDFEKDTLFLDMTWGYASAFIHSCIPEERKQIQFLILNDQRLWGISYIGSPTIDLNSLKGLRSVLFAKPGPEPPRFMLRPDVKSNRIITMFKRQWRLVLSMEDEIVIEKDGTQLPRCSLLTKAEIDAMEDVDQNWQ
jgi:hypothetical protein